MAKTLIVPVDGSEASERAVAVARTLAGQLGHCDIVLLAAAPGDDEPRLRASLDALVTRVGTNGIRADLVVEPDPAAAIVRTADNEADAVICMATHGRGRIAAPLLGSVATEVLRRAATPIFLVGPHCEPGWWHHPPRIVACWCGERSNPILPRARAFAEALGGELWVESVFHPLDTSVAENPQAELGPALGPIGPGIEVHLLPQFSEYPAGAIARTARELPATLLAMTTHARTGVARAVLGSVTMDVVHRSPCPVLVVAGPR